MILSALTASLEAARQQLAQERAAVLDRYFEGRFG